MYDIVDPQGKVQRQNITEVFDVLLSIHRLQSSSTSCALKYQGWKIFKTEDGIRKDVSKEFM